MGCFGDVREIPWGGFRPTHRESDHTPCGVGLAPLVLAGAQRDVAVGAEEGAT